MCIGPQKRWYVGVSASTGNVDISGVIPTTERRFPEAVENLHVVLRSCVMAETSSKTALSDWFEVVVHVQECMTVV